MDIGIQKKDRKLVTDALGRILADSSVLAMKTQNYHWNVKGKLFTQLHALFETQYVELAAAVDMIAERIRALGADAPGSYAAFLRLAAVTEDDATPEAMEMVRRLALDHELLVRRCAEVRELAQSVGDEDTVDMMIERSRAHSKTAWMLRSHIEG